MKKKIFISRALFQNSVFKLLVEKNGNWEVIDESMLSFDLVPFDISDVSEVDWIFFYSKTAVRGFGFHPELNAKIATIGESTAIAARAFGYQPAFIGDGHPPSVSEAFKSVAKGAKVLFPRGKTSKLSVQKALVHDIQAFDLIVYHNDIRDDVPFIEADAYIFTSPLNVEGFFTVNQLPPKAVIVAIGETTKSALLQFGNFEILTPASPNEEELAKLIVDLK